MVEDQRLDVKKRLMFVKGEDMYFLAYNSIVLLNQLGCFEKDKPFKDHRKLAFLVAFVADPRLVGILSRSGESKRLSPRDQHELARAYSEGASRVHLVTRLVCAMNVRQLVVIDRDAESIAANISIVPGTIPKSMLASNVYEQERVNAEQLGSLVPRLRTLKLETVLERIFSLRGVCIWHS